MLTFVGKGYTPRFVENYEQIAARLSAGEEIILVDGPDDICQPLLCEPSAHCRRRGVQRRDALAVADISATLGVDLAAGSRITPDHNWLSAMRQHFQSGQIRKGCRGCQWASLCNRVASSDYQGAKIAAPPCVEGA